MSFSANHVMTQRNKLGTMGGNMKQSKGQSLSEARKTVLNFAHKPFIPKEYRYREDIEKIISKPKWILEVLTAKVGDPTFDPNRCEMTIWIE